MANYNITLTVSGRDIRQVTKGINVVLQGAEEFGVNSPRSIQVEKQDRNPSRATRLEAIRSQLEQLTEDVSYLSNEMTEWREQLLPELVGGSKDDELETAEDHLATIATMMQEAVDSIEDFEGFPGMCS